MLQNSRRNFIKKTALAGLSVSGTIHTIANTTAIDNSKTSKLNFLFQGDSITDGNRGRDLDPNHILGHGYAFSIAGRIGASFPEKENNFYNRGISGNKVTDLAKRWQTDTLDLKPDVLSILVGVNDTDAIVNRHEQITPDPYEETYRSLLDQTKQRFPDCLFVLCEPFISPVGRVKEKWPSWNDNMQTKQIIVRKLAKEINAVFVPLQKIFTDATNLAPADYWIWDGIHPTYSGHELITRAWLKQISERIPYLQKIQF